VVRFPPLPSPAEWSWSISGTYCIPASEKFPFFNKLYHQFNSQGVAFVGIAMDDDAAGKVPGFLKKTFRSITRCPGSDEIMTQYKLEALPYAHLQ